MNISGGKFKGRKLSIPNKNITRPTLSKVRMSVFNSLYSYLGDFSDCSFLDVFSGSGIMSLEALSRGFKHVTCIEQNKHAANIIQKNFQILNIIPDLKVGNALTIVPNLEKIYTVAYVDPPYESGIYENIIELLQPIAKIIVVEHPTNISIGTYEITKQKKYGDKNLSYIIVS